MPYADKEFGLRKAAEFRERRGPDYARNVNLRRNYGITLADYERLLIAQCGTCAICDYAPCEDIDARANQKRLHVDHDHATGAIRGLICSNCNRAVGLFRDNLEILRRAAAYLAGMEVTA